jgi:hypothetical protein
MDVPTMCDVGTKNQTECKPMIENGISNDDVGTKNQTKRKLMIENGISNDDVGT